MLAELGRAFQLHHGFFAQKQQIGLQTGTGGVPELFIQPGSGIGLGAKKAVELPGHLHDLGVPVLLHQGLILGVFTLAQLLHAFIHRAAEQRVQNRRFADLRKRVHVRRLKMHAQDVVAKDVQRADLGMAYRPHL